MKRIAMVAVLVSSAVMASACSERVAPAASVNGARIAASTLLNDVAFATQAQQQAAESTTAVTYQAQSVATSLNDLVNEALVRQELTRRKVEITDDDRAQVEQYLTQQQINLPPDYKPSVVERLAAQNALLTNLLGGAAATKESVQQRVLAQPDRWYCLSYVQTATADEANKVLAEVAAGADFAKIVKDNADAAQGAARVSGTVNCTLIGAGSVPAEIEAAVQGLAVGQLSKPVEFAPGQVVILRRDVVTVENAPQPSQVAQAELAALLARLARDAEVSVNPQFGRWKAYNPLTDGVQSNGSPSFPTGRKAVVPSNPRAVAQPTAKARPLQSLPQVPAGVPTP
ncbi:MAG: peptidylprolyl isomerase [Acidimicrobiia bacterium]